MKKSFQNALRGIAHALSSERNMRLHLIALIGAVGAGFYFHISSGEWIAIVLCSGVVFSAEIINTAIEEIVNFISPEQHPKAGLMKDLAAGAVLVAAIAAVIVAGIIFIPKII
jgi:diacylglycerol kinase (ATP)